MDARVDAYVPASYIGSEALKIDLHRRLALVDDGDELGELRVSVEDRYGELPEPVENLFAIQEAKLKIAQVGAEYLVFRGGRITVGPLVLGSDELRELRDGDCRLHDRQARGGDAPGRLPQRPSPRRRDRRGSPGGVTRRE
jgi:transcription-repair coupling factor (superfamily II helicase)